MFAHLEPFGQSVPINKYIGSSASLLNILILPTVSVLGEVNVLACQALVCEPPKRLNYEVPGGGIVGACLIL